MDDAAAPRGGVVGGAVMSLTLVVGADVMGWKRSEHEPSPRPFFALRPLLLWGGPEREGGGFLKLCIRASALSCVFRSQPEIGVDLYV